MIRAPEFIRQLKQAGFRVAASVPCSYLGPLMNDLAGTEGLMHIAAANEGDAVAIACGAELGGAPAVAMFQNSGLGNAVNPLTSLTATFEIPVLLITTWRGQPGGPPDEPQHKLMGQITTQLLDVMRIPWELLGQDETQLGDTLERAVAHMRSQHTPYALVVSGKTLTETGSSAPPLAPRDMTEFNTARAGRSLPSHDPDDVLRTVLESTGESDVILATTGYTGRALYALGDRPNQLSMVGSMGCASSLGLGLAKVQPRRRIVVLDGDGALLMRMGALATIGYQRPPNLIHIVLDNSAHESTGGQATVSPFMDIVALATACGYPKSDGIAELDELATALRQRTPGLRLIHVKTRLRRNAKLPRPTITPPEVAERLRHWLENNSCPQ